VKHQTVEAKAASKEAVVAAISMAGVSQDGIREAREMTPELMPPSALGPQFKKSITGAGVTTYRLRQLHPELGLKAGRGGTPPEWALNLPLVGRPAPNPGQITLDDLALSKLCPQGAGCLGVES